MPTRRLRPVLAMLVLGLGLTACGSVRPDGPGGGPATPASVAPSPTYAPPTTPQPTATVALPPTRAPQSPAAGPSGDPDGVARAAALRADFETLAGDTGLGVAVVAVNGGDPVTLGTQGSPVAWSTAKVPIAIAVERRPNAASLRPVMRRAITASDNAAAEQLWQSLGSPDTAAAATDEVLRDFGDPTTQTQSRRVRPPYTAFGQTEWALTDQARFAAQLPCRAEAAPVYAAMGQVVADQRWGLGRIDGAHFKGGWGPSSRGYLVRQVGVLDTPNGQVAVALSVDAPSFEQGTATLSRAATWLERHRDQLPAGRC